MYSMPMQTMRRKCIFKAEEDKEPESPRSIKMKRKKKNPPLIINPSAVMEYIKVKMKAVSSTHELRREDET